MGRQIYPIYGPEHDACGIGAVVSIQGIKTYETVDNALKIVKKLEHRAGKDASGETGDGVGLMLQVPHKLMVKAAAAEGIALGGERDYGVGMFFLPADRLERAHPNRYILHNGEINTIRGNVDRMLAREETMESAVLSPADMDKLLPVWLSPPCRRCRRSRSTWSAPRSAPPSPSSWRAVSPGTSTTSPPCWATGPPPSTPTWPRTAWRSWCLSACWTRTPAWRWRTTTAPSSTAS